MSYPTPVRRALVRLAVVPAVAALGFAAVPFALGVDVPPIARYLPFAVSFVAFGLPHGAADHLAVARLGGERPLVAVGAAYLLAGGATLAGWLVAPAAAFAGFILLTWYHWGQGDCYFLLAVGGDHLRTRTQRALAIAVRGGLPMVVPLVAFPGVYREITRATVALFDPSAADALGAAFRPEARLIAGGALGALSIGSIALGYARARTGEDASQSRRGWRIDAVETGFLWAFFLVVPPVVAVGLYFCLWHSIRHVARLVVVADAGTALADGRIGAALAGFGRDALPNSVGAVVVLVGLGAVAPPDASLPSLLGLYLVLLAVLTLPHTLVVTWMDAREGVWSR
ncbi:Brp/Blh family beta-carotene 15,15'-dioxygenase [Halorussus marinus]|uniref:Brp/Blh family beta-carotene 15,15'-dioxygenase n=1 Tax=Halorussus marinus TaxID=2505976 RepID=UPI001B2FF0D8|nr:Brp/Blh family beta-carotene 15,15'-dioxygenase [Halorussus marinus]